MHAFAPNRGSAQSLAPFALDHKAQNGGLA
jgi:hypothetical protein